MNNEEVEKIINNLYKSELAIPILEGYKLFDAGTGALFVAKSNDNSVQQYLEEGKLGEDETFEERLNNVLLTTKAVLAATGFEEKPLTYFTDYNTSILKFKLYLQDNIKDDKTIRQLNAYFLEPNTNYFYEITLSAPPLYTSDINDNVTHNIYERLKVILNNIKYNEENPLK